ncbi:MAG: thiazole synthase [Bacteroidota bacterium]|nr:thiazole synthase [Bacteroidota bacterium]
MHPLIIADHTFHNRLILGSGKYASAELMIASVLASGSEMVTIALKRIVTQQDAITSDHLIAPLVRAGVKLLPNTSGARTAKEAVLAAELARQALQTNWIKLEIHPDQNYLLPDPIETLIAAEELVKKGFVVLPYVHADPPLCKRLENCGCAVVMPLASPIGSNKGMQMRDMIAIIIEQSNIPVIIDAGIGKPSHATEAMEIGASAVLVNTAVATANDPIEMGKAFDMAVKAGFIANSAGPAISYSNAQASSPLTEFLM